MRETRIQTDRPGTTKAFASSQTPRQTTETIMGSPAGENSKHSLAQRRSSSQSRSTPASKADAKPTVTRALNWKSPSGGTPSKVAALSIDSAFSETPASPPGLPSVEASPGSMKMSVCACAATVTVPASSSTCHNPAGEGESGNGTPGTLTNWLTTVTDHTGTARSRQPGNGSGWRRFMTGDRTVASGRD